MLRAMAVALKQHAEHKGTPFDHERDMPECMRLARADPATWAAGGVGANFAPGSAAAGSVVVGSSAMGSAAAGSAAMGSAMGSGASASGVSETDVGAPPARSPPCSCTSTHTVAEPSQLPPGPCVGRSQAMRVAALERLFTREAGSPRLFRHEVYKHIAEHESAAWALCGTEEQREKATKETKPGSRPAGVIERAWAAAFRCAYKKPAPFEFKHVTGQHNPGNPNGFWTTELMKLP